MSEGGDGEAGAPAEGVDRDRLDEREAGVLRRYQTLINELRHRKGVEVRRAWVSSLAPDAELPAHSRALLRNLDRWRLRWSSADGENGGGIGITCAGWQEGDPGYGFEPGTAFMILDTHIDDCMAFFVREAGEPVDSARVVAAQAGEEGEARFVARTLADYLERAVSFGFAAHWPTHRELAKATAAWLSEQPFDTTPQFEVKVAAVEEVGAARLRALRLAWLRTQDRRAIAFALKMGKEAAGDLEALDAALADPRGLRPAVAWAIAHKLHLGGGSADATFRFFWADAPPAGSVLVELDVKRVGSAYLTSYGGRPPAQHVLQLLLDAPGAEALLAACDPREVRFAPHLPPGRLADVVLDVFATQPEKSLPRGKVMGQVKIAALMPAAMVPKGCVAGAAWGSWAPAMDGKTSDGKVLKSA